MIRATQTARAYVSLLQPASSHHPFHPHHHRLMEPSSLAAQATPPGEEQEQGEGQGAEDALAAVLQVSETTGTRSRRAVDLTDGVERARFSSFHLSR